MLGSRSTRGACTLAVSRALILLSCLAACSGAPRPCISTSDCCGGTECVANRCSAPGSLVVPQGAHRVQLAANDLCVVSASHPRPSRPGGLVLGSRGVGDVSLYLRFALADVPMARLERAFLRLEPMSGVAPSTENVRVTVWRVAGPWAFSDLGWLAQPPSRLPRGEGLARTAPPQSLRIDVTEVVRYLRDHPFDDHGLVLKTEGTATRGAVFSTGATSGTAPILELYFRPD